MKNYFPIAFLPLLLLFTLPCSGQELKFKEMPKEISDVFEESSSLIERGKPRKALKRIEAVPFPKDRDSQDALRIVRGAAYMSLADYDKAIEEYRVLVEHNGWPYRRKLAEALKAKGKNEEAYNQLQKYADAMEALVNNSSLKGMIEATAEDASPEGIRQRKELEKQLEESKKRLQNDSGKG